LVNPAYCVVWAQDWWPYISLVYGGEEEGHPLDSARGYDILFITR